jgi:hypothetical protein
MMEGVNLRCIVRTFINLSMYPQNDNNMLINIKVNHAMCPSYLEYNALGTCICFIESL